MIESADHNLDREEALKDDYQHDPDGYDDEDEDDEWAGDDNAWTEEAEVEDETDGKDESSAYLEFLNEEASKLVACHIVLQMTVTDCD